MAALRHTNTPICSLCSEKLRGVHSLLINFVLKFREKNPTSHVSWGLRGREDQEKFLRMGTSKAAYGESPHNYGLAVDLFVIMSTGQASWDKRFFVEVLGPEAKKAGLVWGGDWRSLKDLPHIELPDWKEVVTKMALKLG